MAFPDGNSRRGPAREMAALAAALSVDGMHRLRVSRALDRYMQRLPGITAAAGAEPEALRQLSDSARLMQSCARRAQLDQGAVMPACGNKTRIYLIAERLLSDGDRPADIDDMQQALAAFDDIQPLTMAEYWAFPEALRIAVCDACKKSAEHILSAARAYAASKRWVENGGEIPAIGDPAFFEGALQYAMEAEKPDIRLRLENALARRDTDAEAVVRLAQERRALAAARLGNLAAVVRALDAADWQQVFEASSPVEAELRSDPSGVYPAMAADSRSAVRREVAVMARRLGVGELTVARYAVNAAREAQPGDIRRNVCRWLYDDTGRAQLACRLGVKRRLPRIVPDPHGGVLMIVYTTAAVIGAILLAAWVGSFWLMPVILPSVWSLAGFIIAQSVTRILKPRHVLRMEYDRLPEDAHTLVAIPALLTSRVRAAEMCAQLEALGCLEKDTGLEFVLLGDLPDHTAMEAGSDAEIIRAAYEGINRLNAAAGRRKYHFLHRERSYADADGVWRGYERKRGALMALCRAAAGRRPGGFAGDDEKYIFGRFRYIVTLDADTAMLPGTAHALAGAIAHPLNSVRFEGLERRGFAIMQPRVELDARECGNGFIKLFAGTGGMSAYSGLASDMYHDLTGTGGYCGKGIIDAPAFLDMLEGKLDGGRILSHDMIEGIIAGAGHINDISFFDGFPRDIQRYLVRLERWTRGDWQLMPDIFRPGIPLLGRFRLVSNIIESLREPGILALLLTAIWSGSVSGFALGLLLILAAPFISWVMGDSRAVTRGFVELAVLPATAYYRLGGAVRAVYRTFISHSRLLDWVTSADAMAGGAPVKVACRTGALLVLPGLFVPGWAAPALALAALFVIAPGYLKDLERTDTEACQELNGGDRAMLAALARETWRFYEEYVDESGNFLPPDNVQLEPGPKVARRTSPTNIAMYMLSCVSANELGIIDGPEMLKRLSETAGTLERMDKWKGHIYNWVDIDTLETLRPRYVSAVDSGNLAAALLLCAGACSDAALGARLRALAYGMDLYALYDVKRDLFHIGADAERGRLSASHYDLLASESRILSYTALMLAQVPIRHWKQLGRPVSGDTLMSWSGTMFEYLMPMIFMDSARDTLIGRSCEGAVKAQMEYAAARSRPWGVSESGYYTFDMDMNYQYRAFGMRRLSMGGTSAQDVVAPYAACLALAVRPKDAAGNIRRMRESGWYGEYGMYEAVDFVRREPRPVKSWMAHHQGMALCAICNTLTGDRLRKYFMELPEARALALLLNERAAVRVKLRDMGDVPDAAVNTAAMAGLRRGRADSRVIDPCLLGGAGAWVFATARGDMIYARDGVYAQRFYGDMLRRRDSMQTVIFVNGEPCRVNSAAARCLFGPGEASYETDMDGVRAVLKICVSPESGALVKRLILENRGANEAHIRAVDAFETALMDMGEMRAHPAFHRLFCRTELRRNLIITRRAAREKHREHPALYHAASGADFVPETDWLRLTRRTGRMNTEFAGREGVQTDPCSALMTEFTLESGHRRELIFTVGSCGNDEALSKGERAAAIEGIGNIERTAAAYVRSAAAFAGLDDEKRVLAERAAAVLIDPGLTERRGRGKAGRAYGVFGDMPVMCVTIAGFDALDVLRDAVRMHAYCRALGFKYHMAVINDHGVGYDQPLRDAIDDIINASHLGELRATREGVSIYDGALMTEGELNALKRAASIVLDGGCSFAAQLRRLLMGMNAPGSGSLLPAQGMGKMTEEYSEGFEGDAFVMHIGPDSLPPAPRSNIIMAESMGMLITERGGGFIWHSNSRLSRVTAFDNDPASEGWGLMLYVTDRRGRFVRCLPGIDPGMCYTVRHRLWESVYECHTEDMDVETIVCGDGTADVLCFTVKIKNRADRDMQLGITAFADWLMGADGGDAAKLRAWNSGGALFAAGALDKVAFLACSAPHIELRPGRTGFLGRGGVMDPDGLAARGDGGSALAGIITLAPEEAGSVTFVLGCREGMTAAASAAMECAKIDPEAVRVGARRYWKEKQRRFRMETGDAKLDELINGFILKQVLDGRVRARAGFYQAGGAYGFRDQLQDMLALMPYEPETVRVHILACAARQFGAGDVLHWWHEPMTGVRTRITDDMLFLPLVTAAYVKHTGDAGILDERVEFLKDIEIPEGREDVYAQMEPSGAYASLREHCMRALNRAYKTGSHGLLLMGAGDWNDGMNRVGTEGRGESVWLSMFCSVCLREFAGIMDGDEREKLELRADELIAAVEKNGWDGEWYLRAYNDDGMPLGSHANDECRIDLISQAWAAFAGCDEARTCKALDAAWRELYEPKERIMKLLTPPFTGKSSDPGYIAAYPPGVRENGGQYTHAACWYLAAMAQTGNAERARELLYALMPFEHAYDKATRDKYRVEPYVLAGDVYGEPPFAGRGGWTWYTGSAGWLLCALRILMGFEKRGDTVAFAPVHGVFEAPRIRLTYGKSVYILSADEAAQYVTVDGEKQNTPFVRMQDDGRNHSCIFPYR